MFPARVTLALILALTLLYSPAAGQQFWATDLEARELAWQQQLEGLEYVPNEVIVEFSDARLLSTLGNSVLHGLSLQRIFDYRPAALCRITSSESLARVLARLETTQGISRAWPNLIRRCAFTPNDVLYNRQDYLIPIHVPIAWDATVGSASVNVAVIDTGLDVNHPEFSGRVVWTQNFYDGDSIGKNNVFDDSGHGTAVTGLIAARGNNSEGIAGVAWDVRIMAFRACGGPGLQCALSDEVQAIDAAVARGADVINLSLGGIGTNSLEKEAVQAAYKAGVVIVSAAGNGNPGQLFVSTGDPSKDLSTLYYPAAFPEVIGVAALDNMGGSIVDPSKLTRASFSNYGEAVVSVAAVGTSVQTTVPYRPIEEVPYAIYASRNYSRLTGTSFACPQVAGIACLVLSLFPTIGPAEVTSLIELNALPMAGPDSNHNGVDDYMGHGVVNAAASLGAGGLESAVHENADFLVGITQSPLFNNEVYVLVKCKRGSDGPPHVSYFIKSNAQNAAIDMQQVASHPNLYLGRLHTTAEGEITIQVSGLLSGMPLQPLSFVFVLK